MKKTVSAVTLGCKVNQYDTTAMLELLIKDGWESTPWGEPADVCLVNTCTVTNTADKKSRSAIRRAKKANPDAAVIVCGCMAQDGAAALMQDADIDAVVGTQDRGRICEIVRGCLDGKKQNAVHTLDAQVFEPLHVNTSGEKERGYIKIQEGCNSFCSYCIIPYVRGRIRSRNERDILCEANALAGNGVKELVLTGIHISSYGVDNGESLIGLIGKLGGTEGILRIRLGSLEPHILTEGFLSALGRMGKVCPHFHVSMQSGSDTVLGRMNRKYDTAQYAGFIQNIRDVYENPAVTTDIITGFPGESEAEFAQTAAFAREMKFSRIHVFPYSERKGTPAAAMDGRVPPAVRKERARQLIGLGKELEADYARLFEGTVQGVLFEEGSCGYTDRYIRVQAGNMPEGAMADVLLERYSGGIMTGKATGEGE